MRTQRYPQLVAAAAATALLLSGCSGAPSFPEDTATVAPSTSATSTSATEDTEAPTTTESDDAAGTTSSRAEPETSAAGRKGKAPTAAEATSTSGEAAGPREQPAVQAANGATAAAAVDAELQVHDSPGGAVTHTFGNPTAVGAPLTFMVVATAEDWVQVQLPVRPNGSTGWIPAEELSVYEVDYFLRVSTADNTLDVYRDGALIDSFAVATGTGETPTPQGTFYLTELIAPTNQGYGPYAYGISAFSDVLNEFGGGPGQIGLHGTDDQGSIGEDASHGCIRLSNKDITALAALLPLGTPIEIN